MHVAPMSGTSFTHPITQPLPTHSRPSLTHSPHPPTTFTHSSTPTSPPHPPCAPVGTPPGSGRRWGPRRAGWMPPHAQQPPPPGSSMSLPPPCPVPPQQPCGPSAASCPRWLTGPGCSVCRTWPAGVPPRAGQGRAGIAHCLDDYIFRPPLTRPPWPLRPPWPSGLYSSPSP